MASDRRLIAFLILICAQMSLAQSPSPGTPGEGRGEGDFEQRNVLDDQNHPHPTLPELTEDRERGPEGVPQKWELLHLPGIGGERMIDQYMVRGLVAGLQSRNLHVNYRIYDWTEDEDGLLALSDRNLHTRQAANVARLIEQIRHDHPDSHFLLTSHSGGVGIAAWALEQVPLDVYVDEWFMLSAAVSPQFDLSPALMRVHGPVLAFNSALDGVLGLGTRLFGTVDRVNTDAGGRIGFAMPLFGDPLQYAKLSNLPYNAQWLAFYNSGDHIGVMTRSFGQMVLAPSAVAGRLRVTMPRPPAATAPARESDSISK